VGKISTFTCHRSTRSFTLFFRATIFFTFQAQSRFKQAAAVLASYPLLVVSSPNQAAAVFTPALLFPPMFYPLLRGPIFLDPIPSLLLYIKHLFPFNKQFSSDSFLDWEGIQLGF